MSMLVKSERIGKNGNTFSSVVKEIMVLAVRQI